MFFFPSIGPIHLHAEDGPIGVAQVLLIVAMIFLPSFIPHDSHTQGVPFRIAVLILPRIVPRKLDGALRHLRRPPPRAECLRQLWGRVGRWDRKGERGMFDPTLQRRVKTSYTC